MRRRIAAVLALISSGVLCVALAGCGAAGQQPSTDPPVPVPTPTETLDHGRLSQQGPPPFVVRYDSTELRIAAAGWCWNSGCADGIDLDPPSIGSPDDVLVFIPDFDLLTAVQVSGERYTCDSRTLDAKTEDLGGGWWRVTPQGPADDYTVDLFASQGGGDVLAPGGSGDMFASLRWTTTVDAPLPEPEASLVLVVNHDGEPDSYGLELSVANLAQTPAEYSATITVTAANGKSRTFEARPAEHCPGAGWLFFDEPDSEALAAARLGDFPFTYRVELVVDGASHVATAEYNGDKDGIDTPLEFEPALN